MRARATFDAVFLLNLASPIDSLLIPMVPDGYVCTCLCQRLSNDQSDSSTGAGDNGSLASVIEQGKNFLFLGGQRVVVKEGSTSDGPLRQICVDTCDEVESEMSRLTPFCVAVEPIETQRLIRRLPITQSGFLETQQY